MMSASSRLWIAGGMGALAAALGLAACVGDAPVVAPTPDAAPDVGVGDAGSGADAKDAKADAAIDAPPLVPPLICQNAGVCTPTNQLCCVATLNGGCKEAGAPDARVCDPKDPELRCSNPAHCGGGTVCCASKSNALINPPPPYNTTCESSCTGSGGVTRYVVCDPKGAPCVAGSCQAVVDAGANLPVGYFVCK